MKYTAKITAGIKKIGQLLRRNWRIKTISTVFLLIALTHISLAESIFSLDDIAAGAIAKVMFGITWVLSLVLGIVIGLETFVIGSILNASLDIINSPVVQVGFPITLSIANLGFVVALIIIAIGTILQSASYNAKQILFKLVSAAILVNFSLVIVGSLLRVSDTFSVFFLKQIGPEDSGNGWEFSKFADSISGAFQPQKSFSQEAEYDKDASLFTDGASFSQSVAKIVTAYGGLVLSVILLVGIVITLAVIAFMLVYRYTVILMLILVMPFAWLASLFSYSKKWWEKWWSNFNSQLLFTPVVLFGLYLAILTAKGINTVPKDATIPKAFGASMGEVVAAGMVNILNLVTISGIMLGSVALGSSIGGQYASMAENFVKRASSKIRNTLINKPARAVSRGVQNTAAKYGGRAARGTGIALLNSKLGKNTASGLQKLGAGFSANPNDGTAKKVAKKIGNATTALLGRKLLSDAGSGIEKRAEKLGVTQKKNFAEEINEKSKNTTKARLNSGNLSGTEFVEAVKAAFNGGYLGEVKNLQEQLAKNSEIFAKIGEQSLQQKLGNFKYATGPDGKPLLDNTGKKIINGNMPLLSETLISEAKKQYKDYSDQEKAALLNDADNRKKLNEHQTIALAEDLMKEDKLGLINKNMEHILNKILAQKNEKGEIKKDANGNVLINEGYKYIDANGVEKTGNYFDSIGRGKTLTSLETGSGLAIIKKDKELQEILANADASNEAKQAATKAHQDAIKNTFNQDPKAIAGLVMQNIATLKAAETPGNNISDEDRERASIVLGSLYNGIEDHLYGEKMRGFLKQVTAVNGVDDLKKSLEKTREAGEYLKRKDGKKINVNIQLHESVLKTNDTKPHIYQDLIGQKVDRFFLGNTTPPGQPPRTRPLFE